MTTVGYYRSTPCGPSIARQIETIRARMAEELVGGDVQWLSDIGSSNDSIFSLVELAESNKIDRAFVYGFAQLSMSFQEGATLLARLCESGVTVHCKTLNVTGCVAAQIILSIAEMESERRLEHQAAGVLNGKRRGIYRGRKRGAVKCGVNPNMAIKLRRQGMTHKQVADRLGVSVRTVARYVKALS